MYIYIYTYVYRYISATKEGNPVIYDNMDGPYQYAKQNKSDRERQMLYDLTYM